MTDERKYTQKDLARKMGFGLQIGASVGILVGLFLGVYGGMKYSEGPQTEATHQIRQRDLREVPRTYSASQQDRK